MSMNCDGWGVQRWAIHLSQLLNAANPPDRYRFDVGSLAKEISKNFFPGDPITEVIGTDLEDCEGALLPSSSGKRWGIYFSVEGSPRRRRFTTAHEFGHYLLHRKKYPQGLRCDEAAVDGRAGTEIEREANEFAATLLMPLDDFRRQIPANDQADFDQLSACATRYEVSLVAAILRWLRYTERRAIILVSRDGFMKWAWSSEPALKSGRYFRTSGAPVELPPLSAVGRSEFTDETRAGIDHPAGVWFAEPTKELSIRSARYDLTYTLLHLSNPIEHVGLAEPNVEDAFDRLAVRVR
jgi:IrrE N-terminal-like domain